MRGRCVENARSGIAQFVGQRHSLTSGIVGQAEHDEVCLRHERLARGSIFALDGIEIGNQRKPVLRDHAPSKVVGFSDQIALTDAGVEIGGVLSSVTSDGREVPGLSDEGFHRLTLWLDCNSEFFGSYENTGAQSRGEVVQPTLE